ncbi:MAG: proline--tRNA ligase [Bacilli bacterium]|nr:proline--tRNA ligase [Bacilli bacterium]
MKIKGNYFFTLREDSKDEESKVGNLLIRSGMIKKVGSGNYAYLPLGFKVINKIKKIVNEEMNKLDIQEFNIDNDSFIEEISSMNLKSYKDLPFNLYQINNKNNDVKDDCYSLLNSKKFITQDIYSIVKNEEMLNEAYQDIYNAYSNICNRIGLDYKIVHGVNSKEFQVLTDIGEDTIVLCDKCSYAANLNAASHELETVDEKEKDLELVHTPNAHTIEDVCNFLKLDIKHSVKALLMSVDGKLTIFFVRGDRSLNEAKVLKLLDAKEMVFATDEQIAESNAFPGFTGPVGLEGCQIVIDEEVLQLKNFCVGANKEDYHYINANVKDINYDLVGNIADVIDGDKCPLCGNNLSFKQSVEVGNLFDYCKELNITYLDENNQEQNPLLGRFTLNLSRLFTTCAEQNHDDWGLIFPTSIAPYQVALVQIDTKDKKQTKVAEKIYNDLTKKGIDVIYDNRDERPGVKFKDMDLIGIPLRITVGRKIADKKVEFKKRTDKEAVDVEIKEVVKLVKDCLND